MYSNTENVTAECCLNWKCALAFEGHLALPYLLFSKVVSSQLRIHLVLGAGFGQCAQQKMKVLYFPLY